MQKRGSDTVLQMACGLQDLMRDGKREESEALGRIQDFLDDFYQAMECFCALLCSLHDYYFFS